MMSNQGRLDSDSGARTGSTGAAAGGRPLPQSLLTGPLRWVIILALGLTICLMRPQAAAPHLELMGREYIGDRYPTFVLAEKVQQTGFLGSYKLTYDADRGLGDVVQVILRLRDHGDRIDVLSLDIVIGSGRSFPFYLAQVAMVFALLYLILFVRLPQRFGRKCPRDGALLRTREATVIPPQYDKAGHSRPAIIERWLECPKCDFRHVMALKDPLHRPSAMTGVGASGFGVGRESQIDESIRRRREAAPSDEEYERQVAQAVAAARYKSSSDSPWLTIGGDGKATPRASKNEPGKPDSRA